MCEKHLDRYVTEFSGRYNIRESDTIDQMQNVVAGMVGKRLMYRELIADQGLPARLFSVSLLNFMKPLSSFI